MMMKNKKAQVTLFVIIAIVMVASIGLIYYLQAKPTAIPSEFQPVENYFLDCLGNGMQQGAELLGAQAGYIELPKFEQGSSYMPFSSQLDFFGNAVPYWFYISGNNIVRQQVPSLKEMEKQLANFLQDEVEKCDFSVFEQQGFEISEGNAKASVSIKENAISANLDFGLTLKHGETTIKVASHKAEIKSKLGKFYNIAQKIYGKEQSELFLENYTIDALHLYAPVNDVELSCAPKTWLKSQVESDLQDALSANLASLKIKGSYYKLANSNSRYFVVGNAENVDENVNFLYLKTWPMRFEVWSGEKGEGEKGELLLAKPIGMQQGLGILGFCFVQYHFIYDLAFPVLVQIFDEKELFQFPVAVIISKNNARNAILSEMPSSTEIELCKYKTTSITVSTFNSELKPVEADINFKCFNEECDIGKTKISGDNAELNAMFPQCINGFVVASADGYADAKLQLSTNQPGMAELILQPLYSLNLDINVGGVPIAKDEQAFITFDSGDDIKSIVYPTQKTVQLKEAYYNISVQVFRQGSINIASYKTTQCVKVPMKGIAGFFGVTREQCYDIELPAQTVTQVISGGGNTAEYFTEDMLKQARKISISASYIPIPQTINDLQDAYSVIDENKIGVSLS
jgi:hypothetical protein